MKMFLMTAHNYNFKEKHTREMFSNKLLTKVFDGGRHHRSFWWFVYNAFNSVDKERLAEVGPDRICAEWILRNGGSISLNANHYQKSPPIIASYNALPHEYTRFHVNGIFANDIAIMNIGFEHLLGCEKIQKIILNGCQYLEDDALAKLLYVKDSLEFLQITSCHNIENTGLLTLKCLSKLKTLIVSDVPNVQNVNEVEKRLQSYLPNCQLQFK